MKTLGKSDSNTFSRVKFLLSDIDDTMTCKGKLEPEAFSALWNLRDSGFHVIPVTGRPAGWCDLIIRQWPVDAVVGENGAFVMYFEDDQLKVFRHPDVESEDPQRRLTALRDTVLRKVPGCRVAKDQFSRWYDLAIDFCEDPPDLGLAGARKIADVCQRNGAQAKISSIHVNAWYGSYDKLGMARLFLGTRYNLGEDDMKNQVVFVGDSPNDEPMFSWFPLSVGVSNIRDFEDDLDFPPAYVTQKDHGRGFAEIAAFVSEAVRMSE